MADNNNAANQSIRSSRSLDDIGFTTASEESTRESRTLSLDLDTFEEDNDDTSGGDDEIRIAKAMALAIQQNPQLTPAELKELMTRARAPVKSPSTRTSKSPLLKTISKGVKSSVKKAFKTPERESVSRSTVGGPAVPATDFWDSRIPSRDHSETDDPLPPTMDSIRIMGIIWKRRSGLGKYSTTAAWERRRVVLKGSKLYYYRTKVDKKQSDDDNTSGDEHDDDGLEHQHYHTTPAKSKSWLDTLSKPKSKGDARGYLDLIKDNASVGASFGHSGAPTPFALSIKVLAQTKWKLCFDTHGELMQWLAAMTDVIVQGSVDSYNTQILAANDPSRLIDSAYHGQLSEPPLIAHSGATMGGHRLWVTGHYKVQSDNYPEDISEQDLEDADLGLDDDDDDDDATRHEGMVPKAPPPTELVLSLNGGREVWTVPALYIWQWGFLWNMVVFLARASSTTVDSFWYLITFANLALFGFMTKERVGGTVKPNMPVTPRMARRLSTALGIPPTELTVSTKEKKKEDAIPEPPPPTSVKPKAGTTSMRIENPTDLPVNKDGHVFAGWRWADPSMMLVRSHNYKQDKLKVPSPGELYKCVHVDIFESRTRYPDMASRVQLPAVNFVDEGPKTWNSPDVFVISIAIPTDPPKLYSNTENGGGYTVTMYFVMHQETRDILKRVTADGYNPKNETTDDMNKSKVNAVRLLEEWCRRAPTDDAFCARFKVLPNAQNLKEIGLPSWIAKYNGKPFLIKRPGQTGFLYRHPDKSCVEFDISLHPFPYLAKQGICFMKDTYFKKVLVTFGFLIEGRAEDELPECLIGLMQLCYPDPVHAIQGEDLMAGTSPKSFE